jgi:hypothetical protein
MKNSIQALILFNIFLISIVYVAKTYLSEEKIVAICEVDIVSQDLQLCLDGSRNECYETWISFHLDLDGTRFFMIANYPNTVIPVKKGDLVRCQFTNNNPYSAKLSLDSVFEKENSNIFGYVLVFWIGFIFGFFCMAYMGSNLLHKKRGEFVNLTKGLLGIIKTQEISMELKNAALERAQLYLKRTKGFEN